MIHPRMATMLSVVMTDATAAPAGPPPPPARGHGPDLEPADGRWRHEHQRHGVPGRVRRGRRRARDGGHAPRYERLGAAVTAVARDLARQQASDGEGATTLITCQVSGGRDDAEARAVARSVIGSSLLKAAVHGRDPNWGRIAGAIGNARLPEAAILEAGGMGPDEAAARAGTPGDDRPGPGAHRDRRHDRVRRAGRRRRRLLEGRGPRADGRPRDADPHRPRPRQRDRRGLRLRPHRGVRPTRTPSTRRERDPGRQARRHDHRRAEAGARRGRDDRPDPAGHPRPWRRQADHRVARAPRRPQPVRGRPPRHRCGRARGRGGRPARRRQQRAGRRPARRRRRCRRPLGRGRRDADRRTHRGPRARRPCRRAPARHARSRCSSVARCRSSLRSPATRSGIVCNVNADDVSGRDRGRRSARASWS